MTAADSGEVQTVVAARRLRASRSVFIGVGRPSTAAILARMVHNPGLVLVYESGAIGAKPLRIPLSIGDGELAETADAVVSVPEMFNYWIGPGRIDVAFLGAAQVDRFCNLNSTVIGDYDKPRTRLPGAGGAPEIAASCREVVVVAPHSPAHAGRAARLPHHGRARRRPGRARAARLQRPRADRGDHRPRACSSPTRRRSS
jgi:glutaconate CoA-transferase subunit B